MKRTMVSKKTENKFRKTPKGSKLYKLNIASYIMFVLSFICLGFLIFNEGNTLSFLLISLAIISYILVLGAVLSCTTYYYSLLHFEEENKNKKEK